MNTPENDRWVTLGVLPGAGPWEIRVRIATVNRRTEIVGIRLEPARDVDPAAVHVVSARSLAAVRLKPIKKALAERLSVRRRPKVEEHIDWDWNPPGPGRAYGEEFYDYIAQLYSMAYEDGQDPNPSIRELFAVEKSDTVNKWIARARKLGFLTYPERPGIAGGQWIPPQDRLPSSEGTGG